MGIMRKIRKWAGNDAILESKIARLEAENRYLRKDGDKHRRIAHDAECKYEAVRKKVRSQVEADIYWECHKIQKRIEAGESKDNVFPAFNNIQQLQGQLASLSQQRQLGGIAGLLGRGLF